MKQNAKKLCSLLVVLCLLVGIVPFGVFATESSGGAEILYQQLVLCDDLTMNFVITVDESVADMAEAKLSVGGEETVYTVSKLTPDENGNYLVSVDVAAAQMTDSITVTVTAGENELVSKDYTILAYAEYILNGNYGDTTKALVKEMLNYGAKAQTYFDYNVGSLAEYENVTPAAMPTEVLASSKEGSVDGIEYYGSSLLLTGKLAIRYYFTAPNGVEGYTFTANGNTYNANNKQNNLYYIDVAGINPQDIDDPIVMTVSNGNSSLSVGYGPMHYITRMYNGNGSENLKSLLQALYGYHLAAEAFLKSGETQEEIEELTIPEGAILIQDYSTAITPNVPGNWGSGPAAAYSNYHATKDGRAGVLGFGSNSEAFMWYTGVGLDNMDLREAETITFRMKVDSRIRNLNIKHDNIDEYNLYQHISVFDDWTEVTVNVADLNFADLSNASIQFQFATWNNGEVEYVLLDQVYFTERVITELPIPEGATLIQDYSTAITPNVPGNWGSGPAAAYANSYEKKDDRAGVLGFGSNCDAFMWYTGVGLDNMDLSKAETITFRMKVDSRIRNLNIKHDNIAEYNLYQHITEFDKWTEVTVPVANLNFADLSNASIQFQFATWNYGEVEYVLLDQVYFTERVITELPIPEGATLICDYSEPITPYVPDNWGHGSAGAYYNSHDIKDDRAGVFGFGSNGECFEWYTGVGMDGMDLRNATHITFRMKVDSRIRNLNITHGNIAEYNLYQHITAFDQWTEVTVPISDLNFADLSNASIQFQFATWNYGEVEYVLLDQVYVTCQELAIPAGATLICDYSQPITPYVPDNWGHGSAGAYYNSHDNKDGRVGVFGMGANGECFEWYTGVGMDGMNLTGATTITFRIKVDSRIRNLNIKHDNIAEYNLYQHISVFDQWTEVTVNIADLNFADLSNASIQFQFATWNNGEVEYVLFDQVYIQ